MALNKMTNSTADGEAVLCRLILKSSSSTINTSVGTCVHLSRFAEHDVVVIITWDYYINITATEHVLETLDIEASDNSYGALAYTRNGKRRMEHTEGRSLEMVMSRFMPHPILFV